VGSSAPAYFADLWSTDRDRQNRAYTRVLEQAAAPVAWAYEVWDDVVGHLASDRAIAAPRR